MAIIDFFHMLGEGLLELQFEPMEQVDSFVEVELLVKVIQLRNPLIELNFELLQLRRKVAVAHFDLFGHI